MNIQEFEKQLRLNYSSKDTVKSYMKQIRPFLKFCEDKIDQEKLNEYLLERRDNVSPSSYNLFLNAFKKYCEYSKQEFVIPKQKTIKAKKYPYWTVNELKENVIKYTAQLFTNYSEIDLIFYTMFFTGLRPKEICELQIKDIDFSKQLFRIKNGKGEKDRIIPFLNNGLSNKLKKYVIGLESKYLFSINKTQLEYAFNKVQKELGFDYEVSPYIMRRSFAKYCVSQRIDISLIQLMMGHEDIKTTLRYAQPDERMLIEICEKVRDEK